VKRILTLGVLMIALATAAPALASPGQSATQSAGTVQVDSATVSPSLSASTPVDVDAPVCVASDCSDASATQTSGGASAGTTSGSTQGGQTAEQSGGTAQVTSLDASPSVSVNAPVDANAPVCVASDWRESSPRTWCSSSG
jgi:hypothetical protein